jgi:hypothetical protein
MQYTLMLYINESRWPCLNEAQKQESLAAYRAYTAALKEAGVWRGDFRLQSASAATTVRQQNGASQVLDGPYADSKEQLAGIYLIDVADLDAALSWASRCPTASHGIVEVRPLWANG